MFYLRIIAGFYTSISILTKLNYKLGFLFFYITSKFRSTKKVIRHTQKNANSLIFIFSFLGLIPNKKLNKLQIRICRYLSDRKKAKTWRAFKQNQNHVTLYIITVAESHYCSLENIHQMHLHGFKVCFVRCFELANVWDLQTH